jgi:hypothetical protein
VHAKKNLENMPSKRSQTQKTIPLIGNVQNRQTYRGRKQIKSCPRLDWDWESVVNRNNGSYWGDRNVLKLDSGNSCVTQQTCYESLNCTLHVGEFGGWKLYLKYLFCFVLLQ